MHLGVPAYFHPAVAPAGWAALADTAAGLRFVVLNVADGPGDRRQPDFAAALDRLRTARVPVVGYLDTGYGRRPVDVVRAEAVRYRDWYGVTGIFLDQVATHAGQVADCALLSGDAHAADAAGLVVFNHGAHPAEDYADVADVLVTFEGPWANHRSMVAPAWVLTRPADQFCHLVYATPASATRLAFAHAARQHAGTVYVTDRTPPNPWDALPGWFPGAGR